MKKILSFLFVMILLISTALALETFSCEEEGATKYVVKKGEGSWRIWLTNSKDEMSWNQFKKLNEQYLPRNRKLDSLIIGDQLCITKGNKDLIVSDQEIKPQIVDNQNLFSESEEAHLKERLDEIGKKCKVKVVIETSETITSDQLKESFYEKYNLDSLGMPGFNVLTILEPEGLGIVSSTNIDNRGLFSETSTNLKRREYYLAIKTILDKLSKYIQSSTKNLGMGETCEIKEEKYCMVTANNLNMRKSPQKEKNNILRVLKKENLVKFIEEKEGWSKISYKGKEGWVSNEYMDCEEEEEIKFRQKSEKKAKEVFEDFIQTYTKCKRFLDSEKCECGEVNFENVPEPYSIQVMQKGTETTFFLENTDIKKTVKDNKIAKIINWLRSINKLFGYELSNYEEKEKLEGEKKVIYYGNNKNIYLTDSKSGKKEFPLCSKEQFKFNHKFDSSISKEDYKRNLLGFLEKEFKGLSKKAELYFEDLYSITKKENIDLYLVATIIQKESTWNPDAIGTSGEVGLMQIMTFVAGDRSPESKLYGKNLLDKKKRVKAGNLGVYIEGLDKLVATGETSQDDRFDPKKNIILGVKQIKWIITQIEKEEKLEITLENILSSYNAGWTKFKSGTDLTKGTKDYVAKICSYYEQINQKICYI